jgi:hypothetical protein
MAHAAIGLIIGGSLFCIATATEYWPLSHYPMFSGVRTVGSMSRLELVGISKLNGSEVRLAPPHLRPLNSNRLRAAFVGGRPDQQLLDKALRECLRRYEALRLAGRHRGPPIQGLRLYELGWGLLDARLFDPERPDRRDLLAEALAPGT